MKLLIVESPAKSKTIEAYLGSEYHVEASMGHIRDLSIKGKGGFGVDINNNFKPEYVILDEKKAVVQKLIDYAENAEHIYLATDPDREGEAISWHLQEVLNQDPSKVSRIVFNEITKKAVVEALQNDRQVDMNLVHSQESRRILDRIIGFRLSSLLQQKIGSKSAGRVQSVALKLVVEREKEIEAFNSEEYWDLFAVVSKGDVELKAKYFGKEEKHQLKSEQEANKVLEELQDAKYIVDKIEKKERKKSSKPPFITSTLQQDAGARYHYNAKRVMAIAQRLYEGIDLGSERVGLITYMRTDSIRLSEDFISDAKKYITKKYGSGYYKGVKKKSSKNNQHIQDAHEAIRPTSIERTPESIKEYLSLEEYKLYTLIYNRAISSLMSDALIEDTDVFIKANDNYFTLAGERTLYDGFMKIYQETSIDEIDDLGNLPELSLNEELNLISLTPEQKFTNPPHRYTEARLIRKMEELGIGRPSTYALTMETLRLRSYVNMQSRTFVPTDQGRLTSEQLDLFFSSIINIKYTAEMENILDEISEGTRIWHVEVAKFYDTFAPLIENARDNMVKLYPKQTDEFCPECGLPLLIRRGPFGEFTACSGYPRCKYIKKVKKPDPVKTGVECPLCHEGELVERINARGRTKGAKFYACSRFPSCRATYSGLPNGEICPVCNGPMITTSEGVRCGNEKCKSLKVKKDK